MSMSVVDTYILFEFLRKLTSSYTSWDAYKKGVIDENGQIIIPKDKRTREESKSLTKFDVVVLNLRKTLAKVPGGGSKLATFAAALYLLKEGVEEKSEDVLEEEIRKLIAHEETFSLMEEVTNSANPSTIAGLDNPPKFAGHRVFDVDTNTLMKSRFGKRPKDRYKKYLDEGDHDEIRDYCVKNPKESIILRDKKSGSMIFLRKR